MYGRRLPLLLALSLSVITPAVQSDSGLFLLGRDASARPVQSLIGDLLSRFTEPEDGSVPPSGRSGQKTETLAGSGGLPVTSKLVPSGGTAVIHRTGSPMAFPLCVIGPDPVSRGWLSRNRDRLHRLGVSCILVEARGQAEVDAVRRVGHPVPVHPLPFDEIADRLGIRTVPALLVGEGVR